MCLCNLYSDLQGIHVDEVQPSVPPSKALIDYSHEATEFEKKLIQVQFTYSYLNVLSH